MIMVSHFSRLNFNRFRSVVFLYFDEFYAGQPQPNSTTPVDLPLAESTPQQRRPRPYCLLFHQY